MNYRKLFLTIACIAVAASTIAQEKPVLRLSLEEAQKYALEHNAAMQNADLDVKKAEAERWKTFSTMLPQVKAGFDYQNMCGYEMVMSGGSGFSSMIPDSITIDFRRRISFAPDGTMTWEPAPVAQ